MLEIGVLGGFLTQFLARGVGPAGRVIGLEIDSHAISVANANLEQAGVADRVTLIEGDAKDTLERMVARGEPLFDLAFIDADKPSNPV